MPDLLKVLLIDDNPDDRILVIRELKKMFILDVEEVIDNQAFEQSLNRHDFDIVITDYQLRWTTGIEVLIRIKSVNPHLPVIMFTGTGSEEIAVMAMKVGLDDYILKSPQHYVRLAMAVNSAILRMKEDLLRKQTELALQKSEENYRMLVENIEIGFSRIDKDFNIIMVNDAYCRMFNLSPADFSGRKCYEQYNKSLLLCPCKDRFALQPGKKSVESLTQGYRSDNTTFEVHLRTFPMYDEQGTITGYIEIAEDITEKVRSERIQEFTYNIANIQLETASLGELIVGVRSELSRLVHLSDFNLILKDDLSGNYRLFADNAEDIDIVIPAGGNLVSYTSGSEKPLLLNRSDIDQLLNSALIIEAESGLQQWLGVPLRSHNETIGMIVLKSFDQDNKYSADDLEVLQFVSNQIAIAIENRINYDKLRNSELKFRSFIEQSADGVVIIDNTGTVTACNKAISRIAQVQVQEIVGRKFWELPSDITNLSLDFEDVSAHYTGKIDLIRQYLIAHDSLVIEHHLKNKQGDNKVLQLSFFPIAISGMQHIGLFASDITSQIASIKEVAEARLRAEESNRLKSAFLSNISHEIRTPLNAIVGFAALLAEEGMSEQDKKRYSDFIYENSRDLLDQFNNIIEISKIEAGSVPVNQEEIEINEFIEKLGMAIRSSICSETIEFRIVRPYPERQIKFTTDAGKLQQALTQLLLNARKFTSRGVIELGYHLTDDDHADFFVNDTGMGIDDDKQEVIFELFRQAEEQISRKYKGMGIGLNIVKKIVTLLEGEIRYEAGKPAGSVFTISIPMTLTKKTQTMESFSIDNIASTTDKWKDKTILIVEDVESNYQFLAATLRRSGAQLVWARQGEDAIEMVKSGRNFDLVLMDVQLAGIDGYEVTSSIKRIRPELPIVAQTAYAMVGEKEKSLHAGCDDYLAKPIRPSLLIQTISKYL